MGYSVSWRDEGGGGGAGTSCNELCGDAPPKRGTIFRLEIYERVGISQVELS